MAEFIRVTDSVQPRREYTINALSFMPGYHEKLDKPATASDGTVLPAKYTPEALAPNGATPPTELPPVELPPYDERTVDQLKELIADRNAERGEDDQISKSGNKADLVAAIKADDDAHESTVE